MTLHSLRYSRSPLSLVDALCTRFLRTPRCHDSARARIFPVYLSLSHTYYPPIHSILQYTWPWNNCQYGAKFHIHTTQRHPLGLLLNASFSSFLTRPQPSVRKHGLSACRRERSASLGAGGREGDVWQEPRHPGTPEFLLPRRHALQHVRLHQVRGGRYGACL